MKRVLFAVGAGLAVYGFLRLDRPQDRPQIREIEEEPDPPPERIRPAKRIEKAKAATIRRPPRKTGKQKDREELEDDPHRVRQDPRGNVRVRHVFVDGPYLIAHGDVIVGKASDLAEYKKGKAPMILRPKLWPGGKVPFVVEKDLPNRQDILKAALDFQRAGIRFLERSRQANYVKFVRGERNCYSQVGMVGGEQHISLAPGCGKGAVLHEMMHTLGFVHEQNRMDRDQHVEVLWDNIDERHWPQFQKIDLGTWGRPFKFSFDTIMLYSSRAFCLVEGDYSMVDLNGDPFGKPRDSLTEEDVRRIKVLYGRRD